MKSVISLLVICSCVVFAFFMFSAKGDAGAMQGFETATLHAGQGLGDIRFGMTLKDFVARYGTGTPSYVAADGEFIELFFAGGQVSFLFPIVTHVAPIYKMPGAGSVPRGNWRTAAHDLKKWLAENPACGDLPLISISIREGWFYRGQTNRGVKMGDSMDKSFAHGRMYDPGSLHQHVAGVSPQNPRDRLEYPEGIVFYYAVGSNPNRMDQTRICRITIYKPQ